MTFPECRTIPPPEPGICPACGRPGYLGMMCQRCKAGDQDVLCVSARVFERIKEQNGSPDSISSPRDLVPHVQSTAGQGGASASMDVDPNRQTSGLMPPIVTMTDNRSLQMTYNDPAVIAEAASHAIQNQQAMAQAHVANVHAQATVAVQHAQNIAQQEHARADQAASQALEARAQVQQAQQIAMQEHERASSVAS